MMVTSKISYQKMLITITLTIIISTCLDKLPCTVYFIDEKPRT